MGARADPPAPPTPLLHVILHEPEIPNNAGNIGRTCIAAGCELHLVRPLGFDTSAKACRRAGLDYWPRLKPTEHESLGGALASLGIDDSDDRRLWVFTTKSARPVWDAQFRRGDVLIFGKETRGLPEAVLRRYSRRLVTLPLAPGERSLNLATAVCAGIYEAIRQMVASGEIGLGPEGRLDLGTRPARSRAKPARAD